MDVKLRKRIQQLANECAGETRSMFANKLEEFLCLRFWHGRMGNLGQVDYIEGPVFFGFEYMLDGKTERFELIWDK